MEHFIAYHNAEKMGFVYESAKLNFFSRKIGVLRKAIGNTVWVIQNIPVGKKNEYFLCGAYIADSVDVEDMESSLYVISGHQIKSFDPFLPLNNLEWFSVLQKSQSNFSLGFNRINEEKVIQALTELHSAEESPLDIPSLLDIDDPTTGFEGATKLVTHLRRERNRAIVEAKKAEILKTKGSLCCEACSFDFLATYGVLGKDFCEVHHRIPLSDTLVSVQTTLEDLAILCSNCHRIIHRSAPMLSVAELAKLVIQTRIS